MNKPESMLSELGTAIQADFAAWLDDLTAWVPTAVPINVAADDWQTELALAEQLQQLSLWGENLSASLLPQLVVMPAKQTQVSELEPTHGAAWQPALVEHSMPAEPKSSLFQPQSSAMSSQTQASQAEVRPELRSFRQVVAAAPLPTAVPTQADLVNQAATSAPKVGLAEVSTISRSLDFAPSQPLTATNQAPTATIESTAKQPLSAQASPIKGLADFAQLWQGANQPEPVWLAETQEQVFAQLAPSQPLEQASVSQHAELVQPLLPSQPSLHASGSSLASAGQQALATQHVHQPNITNQAAAQPEAMPRNFNLAEVTNAQRTWVTPVVSTQAAVSATNANIPAQLIHPNSPTPETPTSPAEPHMFMPLPNLAQPTGELPQAEASQPVVGMQNVSEPAALQREQLVSAVLEALTEALQREYLRFYSDQSGA